MRIINIALLAILGLLIISAFAPAPHVSTMLVQPEFVVTTNAALPSNFLTVWGYGVIKYTIASCLAVMGLVCLVLRM